MTQLEVGYIIFIGILFFIRLPLIIWWLNRESGTQKDVFDYSRAEQTAMIFFFWCTSTKDRNKLLGKVINIILLFVLINFLGGIIIGVITGKIK